MHFSRVGFASFRNLDDSEIGIEAKRVFFVGENGQGKSNLLEALYALSFGTSFRGSTDSQMAKRGGKSYFLRAETSGEGLSDALRGNTSIRWMEGTKEIKVDGKPCRDRKNLVDLNPSIIFCHEDFSFADGEPERRRFFFDQTAGLLSLSYIDLLRDYRRILKQRNAALKDRSEYLLDTLDMQLAGIGLLLCKERIQLAREFSPLFTECFKAVSLADKPVELEYRQSWKNCEDVDSILSVLAFRRKDELSVGTSLTGPHRDRWLFNCSGMDYSSSASTGQLRLLSLALRVVQAGLYTERTGKLPVLLLDDVMLELDPSRRKRFYSLLPKFSQSFFTFLPGETWCDFADQDTLILGVENGKIVV